MGLALVLIGLVFLLLGYGLIGGILIIVGIFLIFIPGAPYGYGYYRGRRRGPPA